MVPARFALAMQAAGWTLRSEMTLCKTAPMPESVQGARWERCRTRVRAQSTDAGTKYGDGMGYRAGNFRDETPENADSRAEWADCPGCAKCAQTDGYVQRWGSGRPTSATEKLYLFAKAGARYFYDLEAVRVPASESVLERAQKGYRQGGTKMAPERNDGDKGQRGAFADWVGGRNAWNWMPWSPEPLKDAHYAAFPRWLPRLAIQAGTSERGCCPGCGAPWLRVVERRSLERHELPPDHEHYRPGRYPTKHGGEPGTDNGQRLSDSTTLGWRQSCACPPHEPVPATVLDCFGGSGTTGIEANALGRHAVLCELQEKYVAIAHKRLSREPVSLFAWEQEEGAAG